MRRLRPLLICTALFSAMTLVASEQRADAAPFAFGTLVASNHGCTPQVTCPDNGDGDQDHDYEVAGGAFVSATNATDGFNDPFFTYLARARASFGQLQAQASVEFDLPDESIRTAGAFAFVTDSLTLSAPGLAGQAGTLDVSFLIDGILESTGNGGASAFAALTWGGSSSDPFDQDKEAKAFEYMSAAALPSGPVVVPVSFVWGQPFYLSMILGVGAGTPATCLLCDSGDAILTPVDGSGSGNADFYHTMTLVGLVAKDAKGNLVDDVQFGSGSGTRYSPEGVVPEPASLLLLGTGLAFTFRRRRRG